MHQFPTTQAPNTMRRAMAGLALAATIASMAWVPLASAQVDTSTLPNPPCHPYFVGCREGEPIGNYEGQTSGGGTISGGSSGATSGGSGGATSGSTGGATSGGIGGDTSGNGTGAGSQTQLTFQPHCSSADRVACPTFSAVSANQLTTGRLRAGDLLDIDVVLKTNEPSKVNIVRAWLKYDPAMLEARSVDLTATLPQPIPGEQTVDDAAGIVKIGGGTSGALATADTPVARVTFRVKSATADSIISFHNFRQDGSGETAVNSTNETSPSMLTTQPTSLLVDLSDGQAGGPTGGSVIPNPTDPNQGGSSSSAPSGGSPNSAFTLLQVQDVRATTRDTSIFVGWRTLQSAELAGYNVYYGTVSGQYIQRRSVPKTSTSLVIRDLEPGTRYYLAVRAFNAQNQETVFSNEVSVVVGRPETSTAPLADATDPEPLPDGNPIDTHNGKNVTETGMSSMLIGLLIASAGIGTYVAWRRQFA